MNKQLFVLTLVVFLCVAGSAWAQYCPSCGTQVGSAKFCPNCGANQMEALQRKQVEANTNLTEAQAEALRRSAAVQEQNAATAAAAQQSQATLGTVNTGLDAVNTFSSMSSTGGCFINSLTDFGQHPDGTTDFALTWRAVLGALAIIALLAMIGFLTEYVSAPGASKRRGL